MSKTENPAGRLLSILKVAKAQPVEQHLVGMWASVFELPKNDHCMVSRRLLQVHDLVDEVESTIKSKTGINHDLYLRHFHNIRTAIRMHNLNEQWKGIHGQLNDTVILSLEHCDHLLAQEHSENVISDEDLKKISAKVDKLFDEIQKVIEDDELRILSLELLEKIRQSIASYRIRGAKGIKEAYEAAVGSLAVNQNVVKSGFEKHLGTLQRLGELLSQLDGALSKATGLYKKLSRPWQVLLGNISKDEEISEQNQDENL